MDNKIYNEDCLETLSYMDDNSVDLIITSPPYNLNLGESKNKNKLWNKGVIYDTYNDNMKQEDYEKWQCKVMRECVRVLKPTGSIFYNHKDRLVNGYIVPPKWCYQFKVHQQIIWNRGSSQAFDKHYFIPVAEYLYWIIKDEKKFKFDRTKAYQRKSIWDINFEINTKHPAPFPLKLVSNIVCSCSNEGDLIYDPFMGSGTVAVAAKRYNRNFIGSEISEQYVKLAEERIRLETIQLKLEFQIQVTISEMKLRVNTLWT